MGQTMTRDATDRSPYLDWGVAVAKAPGERESGDVHTVRPMRDGVLVGVLDGLGHGLAAADAARRGAAALTADGHPSVISLLRHCHRRLSSTRGAVVTLARFHVADDTMTWIGVGNVQGVLLRRDPHAAPQLEHLLVRPGIVGVQLPALQAGLLQVAPGDILAVATDGLRPEFVDHVNLTDDPQEQADHLMRRFARDNDDALVFVGRYRGRAEPR
jgi:hypothetical protein